MWTIGRQAGLRRDTDFMAGKTAVSARMCSPVALNCRSAPASAAHTRTGDGRANEIAFARDEHGDELQAHGAGRVWEQHESQHDSSTTARVQNTTHSG